MKPMNSLKMSLIVSVLILGFTAPLMAEPEIPESEETAQQPRMLMARKVILAQEPFRVNNLAYGYVVQGEHLHFKIMIDFNKNIDLSCIQFGSNVRWLVKDMNGFYKDTYPAGGDIEVDGNRLIWTSKEPAISGHQKLLLKGTLKSTSGDYLNCEGNCRGAGRDTTVYDSGIYALSVEKI